MALISKKSAVSRISDLLIIELKGQRIPTWNEVYNAIGEIPSVPAVPLDKLCELLEKCGADSYCGTCKQIMGGCFTVGNGCGSEYFWKELLTKWMEGLDGKTD